MTLLKLVLLQKIASFYSLSEELWETAWGIITTQENSSDKIGKTVLNGTVIPHFYKSNHHIIGRNFVSYFKQE